MQSSKQLDDAGEAAGTSAEADSLALLPRPSMAGRALLAVGLLIGFYVLALSVAGVLLFILVGQFYFRTFNLYLSIFCIVGIGAIIWSIIPRPDRFEPPGPRLEPASQPRLFKLIEETARKTRQQMPSEVYLVPDVNAFVTQRGGVMSFGSRRVMGIGLGLLQVVTVSQLTAVVAHEFGHYYGGDTKLGPWLYKTREAIGRAIEGLARHSSWLYKPFLWYGLFFLRVTHAVSRRQEFVADELAARLAGARALISSLRAIHGGALAFEAYWDGEVAPMLRAGYRPPLLEGFKRFTGAEEIASALNRSVEQELREGTTDIFDTHPSLPERLRAAEQLPQGDVPEEDPPALSLLDNLSELETQLFTWIADAASVAALKPITWEAAGKKAYLPEYQELAREHAHVLRGLTPLSLPRISGDLEGFSLRVVPRGMELTEEDMPFAIRFAARVLGAALIVALHKAGWELHVPVGEEVYCERDGVRIQPFSVLQQLSYGKLKSQDWARQCQEAGIAEMDLGEGAAAEE